MSPERRGGCACRAVRYRLTRDPMILPHLRHHPVERLQDRASRGLPEGARAVPASYQLDDVWAPEMLQRLRTNA